MNELQRTHGNRRAAPAVLAHEVLDDVQVEPVLEVEHVVRNAERVGDVARVVDRVQRAAGPVGHVVAVAEELHGGADHVVALLDQARRGDRAVHAARHRDQHSRVRHGPSTLASLPHLRHHRRHHLGRPGPRPPRCSPCPRLKRIAPEGELARHAHRHQHVRRLDRAGGAGRPARRGDAGEIEVHQQRLAVGPGDGDVEHVRRALALLAVHGRGPDTSARVARPSRSRSPRSRSASSACSRPQRAAAARPRPRRRRRSRCPAGCRTAGRRRG